VASSNSMLSSDGLETGTGSSNSLLSANQSIHFATFWRRQKLCAEMVVLDHMTFSVVDNPELRVIALLPVAEASSIKKMRKIIAAFRGGAGARRVSSVASTAKPARRVQSLE
jgi:hypothetical protein